MEDFFYRKFEDRFRGSRELALSRLRVYLPFVLPLRDLSIDAKAVDIGCGRGEWLSLLSENGFEARGVDLDDGMLESCRAQGLSCSKQDGLTFLQSLPDASVSLVSAFHLVEHLSFSAVRLLIDEALRVLSPGGLLLLETPNPENLVVGTKNFYLDPTHERPIPSELLSFAVEFAGFSRVKILRLQENVSLESPTELNLLSVLAGVSPDYAVVAQKPGNDVLFERLELVFSKEFGVSLDDLAFSYQRQLDESRQKIDAQVNSLESRVSVLANQIENLIAETTSKEQELRAVYASASWQLTYPLRWIVFQFRLLRQHGVKSRFMAILRRLVMCLGILVKRNSHLRRFTIAIVNRYSFFRKLNGLFTNSSVEVGSRFGIFHKHSSGQTVDQLSGLERRVFVNLSRRIKAYKKDGH